MEATKMTAKKYEIRRTNHIKRFDNIISQIIGEYDSLDDAREEIPNDWVVDSDTDADRDGEAYYAPGTTEDEMDGYICLVVIALVIAK